MNSSHRTTLPSGVIAAFQPHPIVTDALVLSLDGLAQSLVSIAEPRTLFYDYVRRMGNAIDLVAPAGVPITAVHLGSGGLTLPRYVSVMRPGSAQYVIEAERGLVDFVIGRLPLPSSADVEFLLADALDGVRMLAPRLGGTTQLVVCDVYSGVETPAHLTTPEFYAEVASLLAPEGILLVNAPDVASLAFTRDQARAAATALPSVVVTAPAPMLDGDDDGNTVVIASRSAAVLDWIPSLVAAGPHPSAARSAAEL